MRPFHRPRADRPARAPADRGQPITRAAIAVLLLIPLLYGAMYVLMTLEDFALFAGSVVAFAVIAATMIATRRIDWYGRGVSTSTGQS